MYGLLVFRWRYLLTCTCWFCNRKHVFIFTGMTTNLKLQPRAKSILILRYIPTYQSLRNYREYSSAGPQPRTPEPIVILISLLYMHAYGIALCGSPDLRMDSWLKLRRVQSACSMLWVDISLLSLIIGWNFQVREHCETCWSDSSTFNS